MAGRPHSRIAERGGRVAGQKTKRRLPDWRRRPAPEWDRSHLVVVAYLAIVIVRCTVVSPVVRRQMYVPFRSVAAFKAAS